MSCRKRWSLAELNPARKTVILEQRAGKMKPPLKPASTVMEMATSLAKATATRILCENKPCMVLAGYYTQLSGQVQVQQDPDGVAECSIQTRERQKHRMQARLAQWY